MATEPAPRIRRLPLRIVGVFGFLNAAVYLAVIVGVEGDTGLSLGIVWLGLMVLAGVLAWFADTVPGRERVMAMGATGIFFLLAMFSSALFALIYLIATSVAAFGWAWLPQAQASKATD